MAHAMLGARAERAFGQAQQAGCGGVAAPIGLARQQATAFELAQHAVHAGFGPACGLDGVRQAERAAMGAHDFQQFKQAQAGG